MKKILLLLLTALTLPSFGQGYLHRSGQQIVDGNNQPVLLRGLGLGGWMIQEGYMLQMESFAGPQHVIKQKITDLIGETNTAEFYQTYRANGITKRDIDSLAAWGFNSVRLPMHYNLYTLPIEQETVAGQNTWLDEGFTMTDNLLTWCAANNMYLILDMHATPGGQGHDAAISDYDNTKPSLWESSANREKMKSLWQKIALRYKDSPWIGAYDIINEPNWNFDGANANGCSENTNAPLKSLMMDVTAAIRQVDTNHMIIIEGNCWGNNYNGILNNGLWDENMALSFHKYWNYNTQGSIQGMLNYRSQYNVPIWLGESGENSNVWFKDAIALVEANNIGWAFWPMKKIESIAGVTAVKKPAEFEVLLNYWKNGGTQPTTAYAKAALLQLANNYKMENVTVKPDVVDAMFRQITTTATKKYKNHPIPGKIFATEYDLGQNGYAYSDKGVANYQVDFGSFTAWNNGWSMRNDAVDIEPTTDTPNNGFQVGFIENGEWLSYTLNTTAEKAYDVDIRYASASAAGKIYLEDANGKISETITLPATGGLTTWGTATFTDVILKQGENKVKIYFEIGNFNLNYLEFKNERNTSQVALKAVGASTSILGDKINVTFNKTLQTGINFTSSNLQLFVNGTQKPIASIAYNATNQGAIVIKPTVAINTSDVVTFNYNGTNIIANDGTVQPVFTNKPVQNNVGNILGISGKIEAEDFFFNNGLTTETANDTGGTLAINYTDSGDYLDYLVNIGETGNYVIDYRYSAESATAKIKLQLINETTQDIQTVTLAPTGGWQTWNTKSTQAVLPAGRYIARITVIDAGFNLNWIKFSVIQPDDDNDHVANINDNCPNTPSGDVVDFNGCTLFSLAANNFAIKSTGESCRSANNGSIDINSVANHPYVATITGGAANSFTTSTSFNNLMAGTYEVCITIPSIPTFSRCFDVTIKEPVDLAVLARPSQQEYNVTLDLSGGILYTIELNGETFITGQSSITLGLKPGKNDVVVKTNLDCQGTYRESFMMEDKMSVYPNPLKNGKLYLSFPSQNNEKVSLQVYSMIGKLVIDQQIQPENNQIGVDVNALSSGTYVVKLVSNTSIYNSKFIRQ
ncbi:MAG: carbohydrate-binding protein [Flavobacterium sp.]|nr:carbohydrate-binding protein [Flavobacterium sp.]